MHEYGLLGKQKVVESCVWTAKIALYAITLTVTGNLTPFHVELKFCIVALF